MLNENNEFIRPRTKIVATLGPASSDVESLEKLIRAGVNVVRLNFSHGTHDEQKKRIDNVRLAAKNCESVVGILADLQGPKIRVSKFKAGKVSLNKGDHFTLDANFDESAGDENRVSIDYKALPQDVDEGDILLFDDGRMRMKVLSVSGSVIKCEVLNSGQLSNNKGVNRLGGGLSAKALTEKDKADLKFAVQQDVDFIAVSFPRDADDIEEARELIREQQGEAAVIAKIERAEAVDNLECITMVADGVMVARGDLAVEIGDAKVPLVQKQMIQMARALDKPVIVATQMMESMIQEPVPTRAEVSDVANAVLDNADAVMLSAETAVGRYPVVTVETVARVCLEVEMQPCSQVSGHRVECEFRRVDEAVAMAAMYTANHLDVKAVLALTESGKTTLWMSRIRTRLPIFGLSRSQHTLGKMSLYRGVYPIYFDVTQCNKDNLNRIVVDKVLGLSYIHTGDRIILTKGDLIGVGGGSNAMKVLVAGEVV